MDTRLERISKVIDSFGSAMWNDGRECIDQSKDQNLKPALRKIEKILNESPECECCGKPIPCGKDRPCHCGDFDPEHPKYKGGSSSAAKPSERWDTFVPGTNTTSISFPKGSVREIRLLHRIDGQTPLQDKDQK